MNSLDNVTKCNRRGSPYSIEPCADVIVSAAARRSILIGGGAALAAKIFVSKVPEKTSFYPQNVLMTIFSHR